MDDFTIIIGGALAGLAQITIGHPFDTVKVRYIKNKHKYPTVMSCVRTIRAEGCNKFYRGVSSPMIGSIIMNIQTFYVYSLFNRYVYQDPFISGSLSGATLALVESPADLIKSRLQIDPSTNYNRTIRDIGVRNIYNGLGITVLRNTFSVGFFFWGYENTKILFTNEYMGPFVGGAVAGLMCWGPTYPLDNIKTRIQTDTTKQYKGIRDVITKVYKKYGHRGLWNGFTPCMIRAAVVNPFVFVAYETGIKCLQ